MRQIIKRIATFGLQDDINAALKYRFRNYIKGLGKVGHIKSVYDIGAHRGSWASGMKRLLPQADFHLFEANPSCSPYLTKTGLPFFIVALSSTLGKRVFYTADSTGDSFYKENSHLSGVSGWREREINTQDLDSYVLERNLISPDFIKLDVQGAELDVLAGGSKTFSMATYLLVEVPVLPYNEGAPNFSDYLESLASSGYLPTKIVEAHFLSQKSGKRALCQLDLFFERVSVVSGF